MDTFFIGHGAPTVAIDASLPVRPFLQQWQENILATKPRGILIISAHWETAEPTVTVVDRNDTINVFQMFPEPMPQLRYPAPGSPELANQVKELLIKGGFEQVKEEKCRGLDHGAWVPLILMYPNADVPVVELSIQTDKDGTHHYNMGRALAPLRDQGILIIGSGNATHNLQVLGSDNEPVFPWALAFDTWLKEALLDGRHADVNHYNVKAPFPNMAHPSPEHFYPLHVALGAAGVKAKAELIHHSWSLASLSYASYRFAAAQ
ncbi:4,5-DOPA dioxygenase extradiol-like [Aristolochia californica]|uniref:4,5-DOPA dioxygenase extradiol-like n=1 Tax=Aristolochia californica TaxID=171875 RepID=UPI0035E1B207